MKKELETGVGNRGMEQDAEQGKRKRLRKGARN